MAFDKDLASVEKFFEFRASDVSKVDIVFLFVQSRQKNRVRAFHGLVKVKGNTE